jgi:predicted nuclease of restriction endonuclease-like (RecB) superfamily
MSTPQPQNLYIAVKQIVQQAKAHVYKIANSTLLQSYWHIGKLIVEDEQNGAYKAEYGKQVLKTLSEQLTEEFGKGYDYTNLTNMRKFYHAFPIVDALRQELSWTHYRIISKLDTIEKRNYYTAEAADSQWDTRTLQRQINTLAFERVLQHPTQINEAPKIETLLKDPYIWEFLGLQQNTNNTENKIETALIDNLKSFLLELGKGFAFVARQQHIVTDTSDFFIDLVFYNYILKCFVIIDLKTNPLSHQDIGQLDMYVRMYNHLKKQETDNPTIGLLLCTEKDDTIVKYSVLNDNNNLFASKYMLYMPKEEELKHIINQSKINFELNQNN